MPTTAGTPPPPRILLITYPRTASNLLVKILALNDQPAILTNDRSGYFFWPAFLKSRMTGTAYKRVDEWTVDERREVEQVFGECIDELERYSEMAREQGKILFAKEHALWFADPVVVGRVLRGEKQENENEKQGFKIPIPIPEMYEDAEAVSASNETLLPDAYLKSWRPAFLVRHPALAFPSYLRAMKRLEGAGVLKAGELEAQLRLNFTMRWTRMLFDWYGENGVVKPLLLDADGVIHQPEVVGKFCDAVGLDKAALKFEWKNCGNGNGNGNGNHLDPEALMRASLLNSSGVIKDKAPVSLDIADEADRWREEFGQEMAEKMVVWVTDAMSDYEYLKAKRMR